MVYFEIGIMKAVQLCLPGVEICGCRFHLGQAVWRHAERQFGKTLKSSKCFSDLVRRCLGLPFILTDELQATVDELKNLAMEDENVNTMRDMFMNYIQDTWLDGVFSPDTWLCFGRRNYYMNNAQEAYNSVINRFVLYIYYVLVILVACV